jgi:hypothetical protein
MVWRTAGKVGWGGGPLILFFPLRSDEATMLKEGICDHRHERMTVQVFDLDHAVRIFAFDEPRGIHRIVLSVAVSARRAVYPNFELSARHCGWSCAGCGNGPFARTLGQFIYPAQAGHRSASLLPSRKTPPKRGFTHLTAWRF